MLSSRNSVDKGWEVWKSMAPREWERPGVDGKVGLAML